MVELRVFDSGPRRDGTCVALSPPPPRLLKRGRPRPVAVAAAELGRPAQFASAPGGRLVNGLVALAQLIRQQARELAVRLPGFIHLVVKRQVADEAPARAVFTFRQYAEHPCVADGIAGGIHAAVFVLVESWVDATVIQSCASIKLGNCGCIAYHRTVRITSRTP